MVVEWSWRIRIYKKQITRKYQDYETVHFDLKKNSAKNWFTQDKLQVEVEVRWQVEAEVGTSS